MPTILNTLTSRTTERVGAKSIRFTTGTLHVRLDDGREISLPLDDVPWLNWLAQATPRQRANWKLEPGGYAVYWEDLDEGIEVCHLLASQPIARDLRLNSSRGKNQRDDCPEHLLGDPR